MAGSSDNGSKPQPSCLIEASQVGFSLDGASLLSGVSIRLHSGEVVGLIGPNGAGKSTLLRVLGGIWSGATGEIVLAGQPLRVYSRREIAQMIAHVPQSTVLDFAFTVREVVLMGRSPHLGRFKLEGPEDWRVADEVMRMMAISDLADRFVNTLSGGERQRVFVARALAQQPRVLLLDEPTSNLDVRHQLEVLQVIKRLAEERQLGVVAAIHNLDLAAYFCDRLVLLHQGRVLADGDPEDVLTPDHLDAAFDIRAQPFRDPYSDALRLSLTLGPE